MRKNIPQHFIAASEKAFTEVYDKGYRDGVNVIIESLTSYDNKDSKYTLDEIATIIKVVSDNVLKS